MRFTRQRAENMPMRETASRTARRTSPEGLRLGERLRQLRVAAGLTQSELAGDRFSKEYVSQIERGKTRPTAGTIEWLADRLGVDAGFLGSGVATDERARLEGALSRGAALSEARGRGGSRARCPGGGRCTRGRGTGRRSRPGSRCLPPLVRPACPSCKCVRSAG